MHIYYFLRLTLIIVKMAMLLALHVLVIRRGGRAASNAATNLPVLTFFTKKNVRTSSAH